MSHTHTKVIFCIKDEPLLGMIQKEFKGTEYLIKALSDEKYTTIQLNVAKVLEVLPDDNLMIDKYQVQFEALKHYTPKK
jgi:hypothetical protein